MGDDSASSLMGPTVQRWRSRDQTILVEESMLLMDRAYGTLEGPDEAGPSSAVPDKVGPSHVVPRHRRGR